MKGETNKTFNQNTIQELKMELSRVESLSKDYKSLGYYDDQIYFHEMEKRFKSTEKVEYSLTHSL